MEAWLSEQTLFVTGSTGFLGKVMLCRLLESVIKCAPAPRPAPIYVLVRGRRDLPAQERFEKDVLASPIFSRVLEAVGGVVGLRASVRVLDGDLTLPRLGLSAQALALLVPSVTVILHMAATVSFNEPLKQAIEINVLGSRRVLELAKKCELLKAFVHTSTCYVNCTRHGREEIREKIYPLSFDAYELLEQISAMSAEEADRATPELIRPHPNTYTFTKFIAEHILAEERGTLPYAIVRPAIIGGAHAYPVPGYSPPLPPSHMSGGWTATSVRLVW